jgi:hypothetical protein
MEALGKGRVPFREASMSFISERDGSIVLDKKTRKRGILFTIYQLTLNKKKAIVSGGNHEGNMSAFECNYHLEHRDGGWQIVKTEKCMIS